MSGSVLHISSDDVTGGAARCAYRLHRGLRRLGLGSRMLVRRRRSSDPEVERYRPRGGATGRARTALRRRALAISRRRWKASAPFSDERHFDVGGLAARAGGFDLVNLHWTAGFLDYAGFFAGLRPGVPVVWTFHDMNVFTGGCHYDFGCGRFTERCGACPLLAGGRESDGSRRIWRRKRRLFRGLGGERLHIVTPSRWLARQVERSSAMGERFPVSVIPYGVDTDELAPRDREAARAVLGIPRAARVVSFVAHALDDRRKGFDLLGKALAEIATGVPDLFLLSVGKGEADPGLPVARRHIGYTRDDRLLSLVYSAADLFVLPTLQDNLPASVIESMACGTPVVAFDVGGMAELVRPGVTGWLAPAGDVRSLGAAIAGALGDPGALAEAGAACRRIAVEEYGLEVQARRYAALYESLLGGGDAGSAASRRQGVLTASV